MATAAMIFDSISHADFLRLTLEAFARQGYKVEQSVEAGADAVLVGKSGARTAVLCKKYRGAFIGRPVLQQFYGAMHKLRCTTGCLITTTDGLPEAYAFAKGKGIDMYSGDRTTELLRKAFGDSFIKSGRMPELGHKATVAPPAARQTASAALYEKVAAPAPTRSPEPAQTPEQLQAPAPAQTAEPVPDARSIPSPEPAQAPEPVQTPEPAEVPEKAEGPGHSPLEQAVTGELPEEVQEVQELRDVPEMKDEQNAGSPGIPEAAPSGKTTIIVCLECNKQLNVPIDQGVITVTCPECGMRRIYQPELDEAGELKTTTVIVCRSCSQKLNVPTNRGQLNVRCPQCKAAWVFTP